MRRWVYCNLFDLYLIFTADRYESTQRGDSSERPTETNMRPTLTVFDAHIAFARENDKTGGGGGVTFAGTMSLSLKSR